MTKFEEWWQQTEFGRQRMDWLKEPCRRAWNEALENVERRMMYNRQITETPYIVEELNKLKTD